MINCTNESTGYNVIKWSVMLCYDELLKRTDM